MNKDGRPSPHMGERWRNRGSRASGQSTSINIRSQLQRHWLVQKPQPVLIKIGGSLVIPRQGYISFLPSQLQAAEDQWKLFFFGGAKMGQTAKRAEMGQKWAPQLKPWDKIILFFQFILFCTWFKPHASSVLAVGTLYGVGGLASSFPASPILSRTPPLPKSHQATPAQASIDVGFICTAPPPWLLGGAS